MPETDSQHTLVRSYGLVFKIERKLFKIDRWRLPLPGGLELRAIVYGATILFGMLIASRLPIVGLALGLLPGPLHWALIPGGLTFVLLKLQIEGRAPHRVLASMISWYFGKRLIVASASADRPVALAPIQTIWISPDWRSSRYRPAEIHGPTLLLCRYPIEAHMALNRRGERVGDLRLSNPNYRRLAHGRNTFEIPAGRKVVLEA
jgi:TcpE family